MVHQYRNNGYNIVLDVHSGSVHVVDDVTYDVLAMFEEYTYEEIVQELKESYPEDAVRESYEELQALKEEGLLFTEDEYVDYAERLKDRPTVVKALCLHIAHDCNLACR